MSKTYGTYGCVFWSPADSRQFARSACICETCLLVIIPEHNVQAFTHKFIVPRHAALVFMLPLENVFLHKEIFNSYDQILFIPKTIPIIIHENSTTKGICYLYITRRLVCLSSIYRRRYIIW